MIIDKFISIILVQENVDVNKNKWLDDLKKNN